MKSRWSWAVSGVFVLAVVGAVALTDRCYAEEHLAAILVMGLGWLLVFVFAHKIVRIAALGLPLLVCSLYQHAEFTASTEAGAVLTLRHVAKSLRDYKQNHPTEGYPSTIPPPVPNCRARGLYEFNYAAEKSSASVTAARFTVVAIPIPQQIPRSLRSFAITEDGHLYASNPDEGRPANRGDRLLE